jgi:hypothetical protein
MMNKQGETFQERQQIAGKT